MVVGRVSHGVVVTADVHENRPKMKLDNNRVFGSAISFPDGLLVSFGALVGMVLSELLGFLSQLTVIR
jgi:hypothetical protein